MKRKSYFRLLSYCCFLFVGILINLLEANGQLPDEVTYSQHIAPILLQKCGNCHRPGNIGPFSLLTYQEAYENREGIYADVFFGKMPPWKPDHTYSHFAGENNRILCQQEIDLITTWIANDCPPGDLSQVPPMPDYDNLINLGAPDAVFQIPEYTLAENGDMYCCLVIPNTLNEEQYITATEFFPDNKSIVHHIVLYYDTLATPLQLDEADPGEGYTCFGSATSITATMLSQWGPGAGPIIMPQGMGLSLKPNGYFVMQMHYSGLQGQTDQTSVNLHLSNDNNLRTVTGSPFINHVLSVDELPFLIPANTSKNITAKWQICDSISLISVAPHMHLVGKNMEIYALVPDPATALPCHNTIIPGLVNLPGYHPEDISSVIIMDTIPIVRINEWDFHWQGSYTPKRPIIIPKNSIICARGFYENLSGQDVVGGEGTADEMLAALFFYAKYQAGDENRMLDTLPNFDPNACDFVTGTTIPETLAAEREMQLAIEPNPAKVQTTVSYFLNEPCEKMTMNLYNMQGQLVKKMPIDLPQTQKGYHRFEFHLNGLSQGAYVLTLENPNKIAARKLLFVE